MTRAVRPGPGRLPFAAGAFELGAVGNRIPSGQLKLPSNSLLTCSMWVPPRTLRR